MSSRDPSRPNVVLIVSDDQGAWAWGGASPGLVDTPHLDALAARGTVLDRFCCASPVCSPARASLLTGRPPSWHGVHDWLAGTYSGPGAPDYLAGQPLITESLASQGYRVGLSGKWHLGASDVPRDSFDHWFALDAGGSPYSGALFHRLRDDGTVLSERVEGYLTDTIADDAIDFLDSCAAGERPFCSLVTFNAPHAPWKGQHPEQYVAPHRGRTVLGPDGVDVAEEPPHPWLAAVGDRPVGCEADPVEATAGYLGSIAAMDAAVGRILARLDQLGLTESTIVVFTSDNGHNIGQHGIWGKGNGTWPLNMYDSSVLVPFIAAGPGVSGGSVRSDLASGYDLALTLCELCGLDPEPFTPGPGRSFAPVLAGAAGARGDVVVHDEYGGTRMIRTEQWKYVHRAPDGPHELYDLVTDPGERVNLADDPARSGLVAELSGQLADWVAAHAHPDRRGDGLPVTGSGQTGPMVPGPPTFNPASYDRVGGEPWPR